MPQGTFPKLKLQVQTKPKETLKETYRSLEQGNLGMRIVSQYAEAFKTCDHSSPMRVFFHEKFTLSLIKKRSSDIFPDDSACLFKNT